NLYGGQAAAYADTFAGKQDVLKAKAEDAGVALGKIETDAIQHLAAATLTGVRTFQSLNRETDGVLGKMTLLTGGALAAAFVGVSAALVLGEALGNAKLDERASDMSGLGKAAYVVGSSILKTLPGGFALGGALGFLAGGHHKAATAAKAHASANDVVKQTID